MKEMLQKQKIAILKAALSTVNGGIMIPGHLAQKHVEEGKDHAQDKRPFLHQMEDKLVKEMQRTQKIVVMVSVQVAKYFHLKTNT